MTGERLPNQDFFDRLFETRFDEVRVSFSEEPRRYGAAAFALGTQISIRPGAWKPNCLRSRALLAHELAHVVQFRKGRVAAPGRLITDPALEDEARRASAIAQALGSKVGMSSLLNSRPAHGQIARHILCKPDWVGNTWFKGKTRPGWAGDVTIQFDEIMHVRGLIVRPIFVKGLVAPASTSGRPSAPEPICGIRVSTAKNVPSSYQYDSSTGNNFANTGMIDVEKGHIMALELGGPDIPENIVPQWAKWQGCGVWRQMEAEVKKSAEGVMKNNSLLTTPQFLLFECFVRYYQGFKEPQYAKRKRLCVPVGFKVQTTIVDENLNMLQFPTVVFDQEQARDQTDEMIALRSMAKLEKKFNPKFNFAEQYDDVVSTKGKLRFGDTGQDTRYTPVYSPPPIVYPPSNTNSNLFFLNAQMQQQSSSLNMRQRYLSGEFNLPPGSNTSMDVEMDTNDDF